MWTFDQLATINRKEGICKLYLLQGGVCFYMFHFVVVHRGSFLRPIAADAVATCSAHFTFRITGVVQGSC
jgi:hypothetical protein